MSLIEEEEQVQGAFSRPVATALNQFSLQRIDTAAIHFGEGFHDSSLSEERAKDLREYRKKVLKDLKSGVLTDPSLIQRKMQWWMSKILEWNLFPSTVHKLIHFHTFSVWELEEK